MKYKEYVCPECNELLYEIIEGAKYFCSYCDKFYDDEGNEIDSEDNMDDDDYRRAKYCRGED